jgi:hypothetical protein
VLFYIPYKQARWTDDFNKYAQHGFVELWPGVKYLLFTDPLICSLQLRVKVPLDYDEHAIPALGQHQIDIESKILTAELWPKIKSYTKFELGFRKRLEDSVTDEIPYFFEFGHFLQPWLVLKTTLEGQKGLNQHHIKGEDWIKGTFGPIFKIGKYFNLELDYGNTFAGRNSSAAQEEVITVSSQW